MSGTGLGGEILGLVFLIPAAGLYIAGKAMIGTIKLLVKAGVAAHKMYKDSEKRRQEKMREELEAMSGDLAKAAAARHDTMVKAQAEIDAACERAHAESLERQAAYAERLESLSDSAEDAMHVMPAYFAACEQEMEESIAKEADMFAAELDKVCKATVKAANEAIARDAAALGVRLDSAEKILDQRDESHRAYAEKTLREGRELLATLEAGYDTKAFAAAELAGVKAVMAQLESDIASGHYGSAAMSGGRFAMQLQTLHVALEQNTAMFNHMKMELERAAAELDSIDKCSRDIVDADTPEDIGYYADEECDAAFWSDGELPKLWAQAEELRKSVAGFGPERRAEGRALLADLYRLRAKIESVHARARQQLASRAAVDRLVAGADESMLEIGWERTGEPEYVAIDEEGHYVESGDPRDDVRLRYVNPDGDERTIIVCNKYDAERGTYVQNFVRFCFESGTPDEMARTQTDIKFNKAVADRLELDDSAGIRCDGDTAGEKSRG